MGAGTLIQPRHEPEFVTGIELENMMTKAEIVEIDHEMIEVRSTQEATANRQEEVITGGTKLAKEEKSEEENEWLNKGNLSTAIAVLVMVVGIILRVNLPSGSLLARYVLSCGLFGAAGGLTNWLAVKMLFDKVTFLYGSGVIPRQFKQIRETVKKMLLSTFFDEDYLRRYFKLRVNSDLSGKISTFMNSPTVNALIEQKIDEMFKDPGVTMMLALMRVDPGMMKGMARPMIDKLTQQLAPVLQQMLEGPEPILRISSLRAEVDHMMTEKLLELTPEIVKELLSSVIRKHLGWLIVWGNVFGALIGLVCSLLNIP